MEINKEKTAKEELSQSELEDISKIFTSIADEIIKVLEPIAEAFNMFAKSYNISRKYIIIYDRTKSKRIRKKQLTLMRKNKIET